MYPYSTLGLRIVVDLRDYGLRRVLHVYIRVNRFQGLQLFQHYLLPFWCHRLKKLSSTVSICI